MCLGLYLMGYLIYPKINETDRILKINYVMKIALLLLIILLSISVEANYFNKDPWFTSKDLMIKDKTYFELFGGAVYPDMTYSIKSFNKIEQDLLFLYDVGISLRFQRSKWFSYSPRLTFFGEGISIKDELKYRFSAKYISFSCPVELQFELEKKMNQSVSKIFFYVTPYLATQVSVHIGTKEYSNWLEFREMKTINWGGEVGVGMRIPTFSLEGRSNILIRLSYLRGLNDTYTKFERDIAFQSLKNKLYVNDGKRYNSAIRLTIGIEIPLKNKKTISFTAGGKGKQNYKRVVVVDEK
jgi:hypothetical protein